MTHVCFLDLDGVLVDFVGGSLDLHGKTIPPDQVTWDFPQQVGFSGTRAAEFWAPLGREFWAGLGWSAEGDKLLKGIESIFGDNVVLMTSPCDTDGSVEGKVDWVKKNLPAYRRKFFVGPPKHLAAGPYKIMVDDHDANVDKFVSHGGKAVLVPRPWNRRRVMTDRDGRFSVAQVLNEVRAQLLG